jgi:hypothetical protein
MALTAFGNTLGAGVLKGHGFLAVPRVFENHVRRALKARTFKAPVAHILSLLADT